MERTFFSTSYLLINYKVLLSAYSQQNTTNIHFHCVFLCILSEKMLAVFLLSSLLCFTQNTLANQTVTVTTKYGDILGYQTDTARVFYGIPFAQPPVNELRYVSFLSLHQYLHAFTDGNLLFQSINGLLKLSMLLHHHQPVHNHHVLFLLFYVQKW